MDALFELHDEYAADDAGANDVSANDAGTYDVSAYDAGTNYGS
jgi:hypothetical protein